MPEVLSVGDSLDFGPLRLFERKEIKTLYVFPERMLPLQRAYFSRGFDLLLGLNYGGESAATMIFGPDNRDLERIKKALEIVSPFVATHPLKRGQYTLARRFVRRSEALLRGRIGIKTAPPMRFTERCALFGTERNSVLLEQVICNLPYLRNVVYTGAWFTPSVVPVKKKWPYLRWYCDTHDVFFVLDRDSNSTERRFLYDPAHQRRLEIALLNQADGVIAISDADRASLLAAGCSAQVITESGSFEHAVRGADVSQGPEGLVAGFIGSNNANNEKCLRIVQRIWWPKIVAEFPDAKLLVAGGICKSEVAAQLEQAYPENVQRLGFVDVLSDFYASVNVMLSPIAVQGGLNFKSVEALMAGRPLLTNELGTRCLGSEMTGVYVVGDEGDGIERTLKRLMDNEDGKKLRSATHTHAAQRFGDGAAYRQLIEALKQENQRLEVL
ncbi:glycosyltransferase [Cupriavidus gilardii]|uniref:glycosyltransferase n=1 Tax=Cupriavidus gilardii TaxID=82541 RepID=UPI0009EC96DD|nr:glycosyltransferase [Cupriavidus gilardii]KAB0593918.1 glycosyltransferase family 4 protein [Cupriavidus gilardii]MCT9012435.1 glycosyltransferase [Cupriavidus gilardii]MCT9054401.1 glycosyltransferase [Cupriavidus gilardii]